MASPSVLILRAPGTNCDQETAYAFELAGAQVEVAHLNRWLESPRLAGQHQVLCLPGGFSYGDDVAAGKVFATQIRRHLRDSIREFVDADKLVLGICNGFQVLIKSGMLLEEQDGAAPATLTWNDSGQFEDRWVDLEVRGEHCVMLKGVDRMYLPVAHAEGKFVARDNDVLGDLDTRGQLVLRYTSPPGAPGEIGFPHNPNGSQAHVAGVCDTTGRVLGLMPHPERYVERTQHPRWTRESLPEEGDGLALFRNAVQYFA